MPIDEGGVADELLRFTDAVEASRAEIENAKRELTGQHGSTHASILDGYLLMHDDPAFVDAVKELVRDELVNAESAVSKVAERLRAPLLGDASAYFRERARDVSHLEEHLLRQLRGDSTQTPLPETPTVLVASDLTPTDAVRMLAPPTAGLVTAHGAPSSHTSILARAFGVPTVVGVGSRVEKICNGESVLVDGFAGEVRTRFTDAEREDAESRQARYVAFLGDTSVEGPAVTEDGVEVVVSANMSLPSEAEAALESGASGVGLYRTELMCLDGTEPPSEDQQAQIYEEVVRTMAPRPVVFRTFDWRGDKRLRAPDLESHERDWLKTQVRAILRASTAGNVSLMFPMVSTLEQFRAGRALVDEARAELGDAEVGDVSVGMMVEVPSAALLADLFAAHADFFAVGTNDLAHYTLASDRWDPGADVTPLDPAVLKLLASVTASADRAGIPCSLCGGIATDPIALGLMTALGFRRVSVPVTAVPLARAVVRRVDLGSASRVATDALACETLAQVEALLDERLKPTLDPLSGPSDED